MPPTPFLERTLAAPTLFNRSYYLLVELVCARCALALLEKTSTVPSMMQEYRDCWLGSLLDPKTCISEGTKVNFVAAGCILVAPGLFWWPWVPLGRKKGRLEVKGVFSH